MESFLQSASLALAFIGVLTVILSRFMKTGFILTVVGFIGYFYMVDIYNWWSLVFIFLGLLLFTLELFIPDFGLLGIVGIIAFVFGIYLATGDWSSVIQDISVSAIFTALIAVILFKAGLFNNRWDRFVLTSQAPYQESPTTQKEMNHLKRELEVGQVGRTLTVCRPSGFATFEFDDGSIQEVDVTSEIAMIEKDVDIKITAIQGNKIIIRSVN